MDISKIFSKNQEAQNLRNKVVRILCFCQNFTYEELREGKYTQTFADNLLCKGWARVQMWAQYADNHKGTCLVFDKAKFQQQFKRLEKDGVRLKEQKITYTNNFSDFKSKMTPEIRKDISEFYLDEKRLSFLFRKCEDFHDENEYRFCIIDKTLESLDEIVSVDIGDSLEAVILGERVSQAIMIKPLFGNPIEQFRIKWNFGKSELF
ncbi:MAG: DUF2971 domain-containing protein [Treponema sp.]|nr:DUF2971 domain-containing protein [Treponema sp.]